MHYLVCVFLGDFCVIHAYRKSILWSETDVDSAVNTDNKKHLQVEETDDSCRLEFFEIVALTRDTGDICCVI